jgi:cell division protein FtsB
MDAVKYLFALWVGALIYAGLSVLFGAAGVSAYSQLGRELLKQEENIENLKLINRELEETMNSLLYDKDTLAVYARGQGYGSARERFIRIVGLAPSLKTRTSAGEMVYVAEPQYTPDKIFRIISFCAALTIIVCMVIFDILKYLGDRA